jgi:hypothetical protein
MAAPKKNLFSLGNKGGRPPRFETPEDLEAKLFDYFQMCIEHNESPMVTTLALFLGFASVQSLYDQRGRNEEFSLLIGRALLVVQAKYEKNLADTFKPAAGSIFMLTNMDKFFKKVSTTDITTGGEKLTGAIDLKNLSVEDLAAMEEIIRKSQ